MNTRKFAALLITALGFLLFGALSHLRLVVPASAAGALKIFLPEIDRNLTTGLGSISGVVYDASTRLPLPDGQVCFGVNCVLTNSKGEYTLTSIPSGWRILTGAAPDHYALNEGLYVLGQAVNEQDFSLSTLSAIGDIFLRIVLNWDPTTAWAPLNLPNDLDANLWFDGSVFERISSASPGECTNFPNACLEIDVQDGYGPETIVVRQMENGTYHYGVLNVNAPYEGVPPITQLDAVLRVYDEFGLLREFVVPGEGQGDLWYVFSMSPDGTITEHNCITGEPGTNEVPVCPPQ